MVKSCRFKAAVDDFSSAIGINPQSAEAFYNRGVAFEKQRKFQSAIDDYSNSIKLNQKTSKHITIEVLHDVRLNSLTLRLGILKKARRQSQILLKASITNR